MIKKIIALTLCVTVCGQLHAQKKTTRPAASKAPAKTSSATGSVNQANYGKVIEYLNKTIDCTNAQYDELDRRQIVVRSLVNRYINGVDKPTNLPSALWIDLASSNVTEKCAEATPPAIMGAEDVAFYTSNYKLLRDAFINCAKIFNDVASYSNGGDRFTFSNDAEGKAKTQEIVDALDKYYAIRKTIGIRSHDIQKKLFPYSVARSPYKTQYINMYNDLQAVRDFASGLNSYEDMLKNKAVINAALSTLETDVTAHIQQAPDKEKNSSLNMYYSNFYSNINSYIASIRELLHGNLSETRINNKLERCAYYMDSIVAAYNEAMTHS